MVKLKRQPDPPVSSSSEEDEEEAPEEPNEDSDTEGVCATPPPQLASNAQKSANYTEVKKKHLSKSNLTTTPSPEKDDTEVKKHRLSKSNLKSALLSEGEPSKKKKKKKRLENEEEEEPKKSILFQRVWTEEEELVVLQGLLDFKTQRGGYDKNDFYDYINKLLHRKFDMTQVAGKVRRLKSRFTSSIGKVKKNSSSHDQKALALSAKIWGSEPPTPNINNTDEAHAAAPRKEWHFLGKSSVSLGLDANVVASGLNLSDYNTKADIEARWAQLHLEETHLFLKRLDLAHEETQMFIDAFNSEQA